MKKKVISAMLCATMVGTMFAGCGSNGNASSSKSNASSSAASKSESSASKSETGDKQVLKVAALESGYGAEMWTKIKEGFEKLHPEVEVQLTVDKKLEDTISPAMKAGDFPDVVHLATGRESGLTETLTKEKGLLPLTDVMEMNVPGENVKVKDKIIPGFLDTIATNPYGDGVTYYAPMFYSPCGLFYDAGLFEKNGWTVPTTWNEMWALGDKAKEQGISLFTYPTTGYFDAFMFALLQSAGGSDFYNDCMQYKEGIWKSADATKVFELVGKLAEYTEPTTVANANDESFTKNQQLILDDKALFCPNGTWLPGEMKDAPRAEGFKWGFTALPAVNDGEAGASFTFFEQMWIPAGAKNQDMAKEFVAYMYSDEAAGIFASGEAPAIQPIEGMSDKLTGDNKMFYSVYDNGANAVMGGFVATDPVEGTSIKEALFGTVNSVVSGDKTVADWQAGTEEVSAKYLAAMPK